VLPLTFFNLNDDDRPAMLLSGLDVADLDPF
jgi:hypothetical protein